MDRDGARLPAEWEAHEGCWLAWPSHAELWEPDLSRVRGEFTALCRAIAGPQLGAGAETHGAERLRVLVADHTQARLAAEALEGLGATLYRVPFGDIWLRDTGPLFVCDAPTKQRSEASTRPSAKQQGEVRAACFRFNGWGGKYVYAHDDTVAEAIATSQGSEASRFDWVLEGGAVEVDGQGTCLTTRDCLLNPNRCHGPDPQRVERRLARALGVSKVLWLSGALANDHTDGHVDTLARFVAHGVVACMEPCGSEEPNRDVLESVRRQLASARDAWGRPLELVVLPSPGTVLGRSGQVMPASYLNFYIANRSLVVPTFGVPQDETALRVLEQCFPGRVVVGIGANALLEGGGAFHCITQQVPACQAAPASQRNGTTGAL